MVASVADEYNWSQITILIGEDERINFRLLEVMLSKTNVKILHGVTGVETFQLYKSNPQIDLILMDIKMPEMDGCEVMREIRKFNQEVPIIAQSAYSLEAEKERSFEAGCDAYITKPINKKELLQLIDLNLKKKVNTSS